MIDRIVKNEERYDRILESVNKMQEALLEFKSRKKDLVLLNKYYGSNSWLKDKDAYESNKISKIKAGVLSEDGVWNMLSDIDELIHDMKGLILSYERNK